MSALKHSAARALIPVVLLAILVAVALFMPKAPGHPVVPVYYAHKWNCHLVASQGEDQVACEAGTR